MSNFANASQNLRHVFINGLKLKASIGIFEHEKQRKQMVIINVDMSVIQRDDHDDEIDNVVCYKTIVNLIEDYIDQGHVQLVETLAENIADQIIEISDVKRVLVRVEKPEAFVHVEGVGVAVERIKN